MQKSTNHAKYENNDLVRKGLITNFLNSLTQTVEKLHPDSILDVGCGEGFVLQKLQSNHIDASLSGIDVSEDAIKVAKKNVKKADMQVGTIYKLPYASKSFDVVLCNEVLEHLENPEKAIKELKRVSGKYVICSVPHEPWFMMGSLAGGKYIMRLGNHPEHIQHWTAWTFKSFLERNGLKVKDLTYVKTFPWILALCEKQ